MAFAVPIFYGYVTSYINFVLTVAILIIEFVALINCLIQRRDAFPVVGSIPKVGWLAILLVSILVTWFFGPLRILGLAAVTAAAVYLLDVRPALRDVAGGRNAW